MKYALHPGFVYSKFDGGKLYIGASILVHMYQISMKDCIIITDKTSALKLNLDDYIHLYPRYHGDYLEYRRFLEENHGR